MLNLLGKGGYGSVYRAICLYNGMEVAIKMVISLSHGVERLPRRILGRSSCVIDAYLQNMSSEMLKSISARFEVLGKRNWDQCQFLRSQHSNSLLCTMRIIQIQEFIARLLVPLLQNEQSICICALSVHLSL